MMRNPFGYFHNSSEVSPITHSVRLESEADVRLATSGCLLIAISGRTGAPASMSLDSQFQTSARRYTFISPPHRISP